MASKADSQRPVVGLVIPFTHVVRYFLDLAHFLYPELRFIGKSVDVKSVSHEGFKDSWGCIVPTARGPKDFAAFIKTEVDTNVALLKGAGYKPE